MAIFSKDYSLHAGFTVPDFWLIKRGNNFIASFDLKADKINLHTDYLSSNDATQLAHLTIKIKKHENNKLQQGGTTR